MEDKELYQHILGLKTPWSVAEVKLDLDQHQTRAHSPAAVLRTRRKQEPAYLSSFLLVHRLIVVIKKLPLSLKRFDLALAGGGNLFDR